jgi:hypothetical protein
VCDVVDEMLTKIADDVRRIDVSTHALPDYFLTQLPPAASGNFSTLRVPSLVGTAGISFDRAS